MRKRLAIVAAISAAIALAGGGTYALGGGTGLIFDDGHFAKPGSLDDGKDLLPETKITLAQADAVAQRAVDGQLGQVDLENFQGRVVYKVDVGDKEIRVDATDGSIAAIGPQT